MTESSPSGSLKGLKTLGISFLVLIVLFYVVPLIDGLLALPPEVKLLVAILVFVNPVVIFALNGILGAFSKAEYLWAVPVAGMLLSIPSFYIFYNSSALIYALLYLVVGFVGLGVGLLVRKLRKK